MKHTRALTIALPLAFSVMACTTYGAEDGAKDSAVDNVVDGSEATTNSAGETTVAENPNSSGDGSVSQTEEDAFLDKINFCKEDDLGRFVGLQATDETVAEAVAASNSKVVRVLAPRQPATMDYLTNRLNVMTDDNGVIIRLRCG